LAGIIFYAIFFKGYRKIFTGILILIFITLLLYYFINPINPINMLRGNTTVIGGDSISTRVNMWNETWQMLKTKPIFGAGLAGYQTAVAEFHQKDYIEIYLYPHNIFLNFWTEIGLLGLIGFILIIIWFYKQGFGLQKKHGVETRHCLVSTDATNTILMASMTTLLVHGLVDVPYFKNDLAILFWLIIGMMTVTHVFRSDNNQT
jgi:O-antigen ligase